MTIEERQEAIAQLERISKNLASIGEPVDYTEFAIEALEQEPILDKIELNKVCRWLIKNVFRNPDLMFDDTVRDEVDLLSVIASLYNLLYLESTGEEYNYFFHWANKLGGWVEDNMFDDIIKGDRAESEV